MPALRAPVKGGKGVAGGGRVAGFRRWGAGVLGADGDGEKE